VIDAASRLPLTLGALMRTSLLQPASQSHRLLWRRLLGAVAIGNALRFTPMLAAQRAAPPSVVDTGTGPETFVLLSGLVGGTAGFHRVGGRLAAMGARVVAIDAYQLSLDSTDVTFDALARRVDRVLCRLGVTSAHVVGHSHGGGIGLRLAANAPERVSDLTLVDVGAKYDGRGPKLGAAIRLVPIITRIPGGRALVRRRFIAGLRQTSATSDWLDDTTQREYVEPVLDNIDRAVAMVLRVANAEEPEPLSAVLARVHVPVKVFFGDVPHEGGPDEAEVRALDQLGGAARMERLPHTAHFPHEEAPDEFVHALWQSRVPAVVARVGAAR
jgi:pimeloyl-ACP methyl ester carboxylesterase